MLTRSATGLIGTRDNHQESPMTAIGRLFIYGGGQAVRLPDEFRLAGTAVRITRVGERLILEPITCVPEMPWAEIDVLGDCPFMPEGCEQPEMPHNRTMF